MENTISLPLLHDKLLQNLVTNTKSIYCCLSSAVLSQIWLVGVGRAYGFCSHLAVMGVVGYGVERLGSMSPIIQWAFVAFVAVGYREGRQTSETPP